VWAACKSFFSKSTFMRVNRVCCSRPASMIDAYRDCSWWYQRQTLLDLASRTSRQVAAALGVITSAPTTMVIRCRTRPPCDSALHRQRPEHKLLWSEDQVHTDHVTTLANPNSSVPVDGTVRGLSPRWWSRLDRVTAKAADLYRDNRDLDLNPWLTFNPWRAMVMSYTHM